LFHYSTQHSTVLILQHLFEGLKTPALWAFVGWAARFTAGGEVSSAEDT